MAIVTGDRYLELLVRFVDANAGPLLDGAMTLRLNPAGLHYVQSRLEALRELEALLAGAPVDYLRAYVSDLGDHRALEHLRRILGLLTSLKVVSALPPPSRDPTPVSLLPFGSLKVLELRGCDLSTSAAKGLLELRHTLERLICHNSTDALRHVFASRIVDIKDSPVWNRLSFVSCACNGLMLMDESLQLLPVVETLELSRNRFAKVDNLRKCMKLRHLDLGFNHLRTIASLSEVSCQIVKLVLRNNALTTVRGLENLKSLEGLDLSYNLISSFTELEILTSLSCLESLWLEGNPICYARWYRAHVFSFFSNPDKLKLDEKGISAKEYLERHVIFVNRQRQLAGHGFYFPAKAATEDESSISNKRKKNSRLACIQDEEQRREAAEQESVSCNSDNLRKEEDDISDSESKIVGLINRVEYMKKERSILWLREFKEWMDQPSVDTVDKCQCLEVRLGYGQGDYVKQRKCLLTYGESSKHAPDCAQTSENGCNSNILEADMSFTDAYTGGCGSEYFENNGKAVSKPSTVIADHVSVTKLVSGEGNSWHDRSKVHSQEQQISPLEVKGDSHNRSSTVEEDDEIEINVSSVQLTAIGDTIGLRSTSRQPSSPPHYQEDILHRRLYLEEEFLQLSVESLSVGSSDSDTSCSDDPFCELNSSNSEFDCSLIQASEEQGIDEPPTALLCGRSHFAGKHEKLYLIEDNTSFDHCAGQDFSTGKYSLLKHDKPFCTCNGLNNGGYDIERNESQDVSGIGRQKGKQKLKRREIFFAENFDRTKPDFQTSNGMLEVVRADTRDAYERPSCDAGHIPSSFEEASKNALPNHDKKDLPVTGDIISLLESRANSLDSEQDEYIKDFFHTKVADSRTFETCEEIVCCLCVVQLGSDFQLSEAALLRSCKNKLYILLIDATHDVRGTISKVLGCYRPEDIRKVVAGLGLQALRVYMEGDATYVFLTRTVEKLEYLLHLLQVSGSSLLNNGCTLESWEQVQVKLLEKHICGSLKMSLFFYSMLLFWHDRCEGESWFTRSLILIGGYMLVCIENLVRFGSFTDDCGLSSPYYSLDSCCPIQNILEMVIELRDGRCLTLTLNGVMSGNSSLLDKIRAEKNKQKEETGKVHTWKLKWFSEDNLQKFVTLVSAIHGEITDSPLPVKCIS